MDDIEPVTGMNAQELMQLRDDVCMSIDRAHEMLRKTELLLIAAELVRISNNCLAERVRAEPA